MTHSAHDFSRPEIVLIPLSPPKRRQHSILAGVAALGELGTCVPTGSGQHCIIVGLPLGQVLARGKRGS